MNRLILTIQFIYLFCCFCVAQNVGINVVNPANRLQIGVTPGFTQNDLAIGNGVQAMSITQAASSSIWYSNTAFSLMPNGNNYINTGYLGIGTVTPLYPVTVNTPAGVGSWGLLHTDGTVQVGEYINANTSAEIGTRSAHPFYIFTNNADAIPAVYVGVDSRVGILSGAAPVNDLQVGSMGSTGYNGFHIAFGNGAQAGGFTISGNGNALWQTTSNISVMPKGTGNGNFGIDVAAPANNLQIGSVGSTGYSANHIAFGNGTQASGITQTATASQWLSTTNIALMPSGNGHGRVGINTLSPIAPLEVDDYVQIDPQSTGVAGTIGPGYAYMKPGQNVGDVNWHAMSDFCNGCTANVSIYAQGNIMATEIDAVSDARVKNITDLSNSSSDLQTLNKLLITDYTLKDKIRYGSKSYKKIIAQQVEDVYPEVVTKSANYIPNVYQVTETIEKVSGNTLLSFKQPHHLTGTASRLQIIDQKGMQQRYEIVAIPNEYQVLINVPDMGTGAVFVYGELVNDLRSVDYDGLTTLNISATQELSKLVTREQAEIDELKNALRKVKTKSVHRKS